MKSAQDWINQLALEAHPEGGYYKRIYASSATISTASGERPLATSIHYLLEQNDFSAWHRIKSDELWYFHSGGQLKIHMIHPTGSLETITLGEDQLMAAVPAGVWFCAEPAFESQHSYTLVSCVVTPGFDFEDFEMGDAEDLVTVYPQHRDIICRLCRSST